MASNYLKKDPVSYIKHLNDLSKLKKSQTSLKQNTAREQNFELFFSGANETRVKQKYRRNKENTKSPLAKIIPTKTLSRKRWETPSTPLILQEIDENILKSDSSYCQGHNSKMEEVQNNSNIENLVNRFLSLPAYKQRIFMEKLEDLEKC